MNNAVQPQTYTVSVTCATCKTTYNLLSTKQNIKVDICSHCHPFYTGEQKIIDTANKVKDFERRKEQAVEKSNAKTAKTTRKNVKTTEIRTDRPLTLRDMLKAVQS